MDEQSMGVGHRVQKTCIDENKSGTQIKPYGMWSIFLITVPQLDATGAIRQKPHDTSALHA